MVLAKGQLFCLYDGDSKNIDGRCRRCVLKCVCVHGMMKGLITVSCASFVCLIILYVSKHMVQQTAGLNQEWRVSSYYHPHLAGFV